MEGERGPQVRKGLHTSLPNECALRWRVQDAWPPAAASAALPGTEVHRAFSGRAPGWPAGMPFCRQRRCRWAAASRICVVLQRDAQSHPCSRWGAAAWPGSQASLGRARHALWVCRMRLMWAACRVAPAVAVAARWARGGLGTAAPCRTRSLSRAGCGASPRGTPATELRPACHCTACGPPSRYDVRGLVPAAGRPGKGQARLVPAWVPGPGVCMVAVGGGRRAGPPLAALAIIIRTPSWAFEASRMPTCCAPFSLRARAFQCADAWRGGKGFSIHQQLDVAWCVYVCLGCAFPLSTHRVVVVPAVCGYAWTGGRTGEEKAQPKMTAAVIFAA